MSEYKELIKNFDRIRDYMREFFVFGFKTRNSYDIKSSRTYDNERRRIENYLSDITKWDYTDSGKKVFISVDSSEIPQNPFYKAYKSKSFTTNDIILHFLLVDIFTVNKDKYLKLDEITELVNDKSDFCFEPQTVRNKLKEYADSGVLKVEKESKAYRYSFNDLYLEDLGLSQDAVLFFSEVVPFGVVGSYLADRMDIKNTKFLYKHHFIVNTLEDNILLDIIDSIKSHRQIQVENFSNRNKKMRIFNILPLMIYVSVQTGRRYLIGYSGGRKFSVYRLDYIKSVKPKEVDGRFDSFYNELKKCFDYSFSTSFLIDSKPEHFEMTLYINEDSEQFIINRLEREGRGGTIKHIRRNIYKFSLDIYNISEIMAWVKSFTGRIVKIKSDNKSVMELFYDDVRRMKKMYD